MSGGCVIAIDPGERWIGVARAAPGSSLALPVGTLDRSQENSETVDAVRGLLGNERVTHVVVGVPLRPDGREDEQAVRFRRFGEALAEALGADCVAQDERFTSDGSFARLISAERSASRKSRSPGRKSVQRQRRERQRAHAEAAARILQRWLDSEAGSKARDLADGERP